MQKEEIKMNLDKYTAAIEKFIETFHRDSISVHRKSDVTFVYRVNDLYFSCWMVDDVYKNLNLERPLPTIEEARSVVFELKYDHFLMNKVTQ